MLWWCDWRVPCVAAAVFVESGRAWSGVIVCLQQAVVSAMTLDDAKIAACAMATTKAVKHRKTHQYHREEGCGPNAASSQ